MRYGTGRGKNGKNEKNWRKMKKRKRKTKAKGISRRKRMSVR